MTFSEERNINPFDLSDIFNLNPFFLHCIDWSPWQILGGKVMLVYIVGFNACSSVSMLHADKRQKKQVSCANDEDL